MKKLIGLFLLLGFAFTSFAQNDDIFSEKQFEVISSSKERAEKISRRSSSFSRYSISALALDAVPSDFALTFRDDDPRFPDSISANRNFNNLLSVGINFGLGFSLGNDVVLNFDNHFGLGAGGDLFGYNINVGIGKEFRFNNLYIQALVGLSYTGMSYSFGNYPPFVKNYFEVNNQFIFDELAVDLIGRGFAATPTLLMEYEVRKDMAIFARASMNYIFHEWHFVRVGGETNQLDSDGEYIRARERINFDDNRLRFNINDQRVLDSSSPNFNYNLGGIQLQVGLAFALNAEWEED